MGGNVAADRFLRSTNIAGNVYELNTTAGGAANNTTIARYATGGLTSSRRYRPTQTTTANTAVPGVGTAPANDGWRDLDPENADEQITFDSGNWTIRLRYRRSGQALEVNQATNTTVILYNGTTGVELGRATLGLTYTTTVQTATFLINPGSVVFAAGDKIQIEVYVVTLAAGQPAPPATATDLWLTINESDANFGAKVTPQTYAINYARSLATVSMVGSPVLDRQSTLFRTLSVTMLGVTPAFVRQVGKPLSATMVGVTPTFVRSVSKSLSTTMVGVAALIKQVGKILPTATMVGVPTVDRQSTLFRTFAATMVGVPTLARAVTLARTLVVTMIGVTPTFVRSVGKTLSATMVGVTPTFVRHVGKILPTVTMVGVTPAFVRHVTKTIAATMVGVATLARAVTLARTLSATMVGVASGFVKIPFDKVPGDGGGGTTILGYSRSRVTNK